jgi:hypothetical protein
VKDDVGTRVVHYRNGKTYEVVRVDDLEEWIHAVRDDGTGELKESHEYLPAVAEGATEVWEYGVDLKYYKFVHVKEILV